MEALELLELIQKGESSTVQFKERIEDTHKLSQELTAFSNTKGGIIIIGVNDKTGSINGLSFDEIRSLNELIVNSTTNNVKPPIIITSETVLIDGQSLVVIYVEEGSSKPYKDKNGAIWVKNGSDKRKVVANEEMARLLQSSKTMFADETLVGRSSISDIDIDYYKKVYEKKFKISFDTSKVDLQTSLQNQQLYRDGELTLAGVLLFCNNRQELRPLFSVQCFSVNSTNLLGNSFDDNEPPFDGKLEDVYYQTMRFIERNIKKVPSGDSFNSELEWEIPKEIFEELIVNALVHRDYFINSTIKVFMFLDRIEIVSPGKLPNSQTEKTIQNGVSIPRNPVLQSLAQYVLPYKGAGTGIMRALSIYPNIVFRNKIENEQFISIIERKSE
ncbi:putative DNA binding domain-containing protein [Bacteroidales bacterium OttesenSCG-928-B11]|nr:putative DNA binding domain-containing protein [Bacteroidales bacterium OttesenSCG-928-B11]MDL2327001.1 putative DNA binding domain-containing protein [Bacteroidales bacterium OttesenSCG-928-A14]